MRAWLGFLLGLVAVVAPIVVRAAIQTASDRGANVRPFPIETLVLAIAALIVSQSALRLARSSGRGRRLAIAGIVLGAVGLFSAFGQFGAGSG